MLSDIHSIAREKPAHCDPVMRSISPANDTPRAAARPIVSPKLSDLQRGEISKPSGHVLWFGHIAGGRRPLSQ